jgi:hypothetical protein
MNSTKTKPLVGLNKTDDMKAYQQAYYSTHREDLLNRAKQAQKERLLLKTRCETCDCEILVCGMYHHMRTVKHERNTKKLLIAEAIAKAEAKVDEVLEHEKEERKKHRIKRIPKEATEEPKKTEQLKKTSKEAKKKAK